jgi:hypothetical protein
LKTAFNPEADNISEGDRSTWRKNSLAAILADDVAGY